MANTNKKLEELKTLMERVEAGEELTFEEQLVLAQASDREKAMAKGSKAFGTYLVKSAGKWVLACTVGVFAGINIGKHQHAAALTDQQLDEVELSTGDYTVTDSEQ